ncbi:MAG TPA: M17 family peptidase N-terminal domain-containing protein, partial [Cellulomonas sp.]
MVTTPLPTATPVPQLVPSWFADVDVRAGGGSGADAIGFPVPSGGPVPAELEADLGELERAGFSPAVGSALAEPRHGGPALVAVGLGEAGALTAAAVRDAAAAFARSVPRDGALAFLVPSSAAVPPDEAAAAVVEGVLLARHRFDLRSTPRASDAVPVSSLVLVAPGGADDAVAAGAARGLVTARAAMMSRDLATCPAVLLTAEAIAQVAVEVGGPVGLEVEVTDRDGLVALGCGGLLGVNRGSANEPRMVRLTYTPAGEPTGHLGLVGKGIMYDAGGISLKPSDESH